MASLRAYQTRRGVIIQPHRIITAIILGVAVVTLYACYPKRVGPIGSQGKQLTWAEMSLGQRKAHMKQEVVPRAGAVFRSWRPDRYAGIGCTLCHGQAAKTGDFRMPTAHLPRLSGAVLLGPEMEKFPATTRLKLDQLVPTMSAALGLKPFSVITRKGFGCYSCHLGPAGPMFKA